MRGDYPLGRPLRLLHATHARLCACDGGAAWSSRCHGATLAAKAAGGCESGWESEWEREGDGREDKQALRRMSDFTGSPAEKVATVILVGAKGAISAGGGRDDAGLVHLNSLHLARVGGVLDKRGGCGGHCGQVGKIELSAVIASNERQQNQL